MLKRIVFAVIALANSVDAACIPSIAPVAAEHPDTLNYPGNLVAGDFYGSAVDINGDFFFVAAPAVQKSSAIYVYRNVKGNWVNSQVLLTGGSAEHFSGTLVRSDGEWLFASSLASVKVYRLNRDHSWTLHQTLNGTSGHDETFGSSFSFDAKKGWAIVGAPSGGCAYFFKLDGDQWKMKQKVVNPEDKEANFGAVVEINDSYAFISNADLQNNVEGRLSNSSVWVFKLSDHHWKFTQKLKGSQTQAQSDAQGFFDAFGSSLSIYKDWAVVGAMLDNKAGRAMGAAYIYKRKDGQWVLKKQIVSDEPFNSQVPGHMLGYLNGVRIYKKQLLVGDPGHSGPKGETHQGAVLVYGLDDGEWILQNVVFDPNGIENQFFGASVAIKEKDFLAGTMTALDIAYPAFIPSMGRQRVEISREVFVPVVAEGSAVLYNVECH